MSTHTHVTNDVHYNNPQLTMELAQLILQISQKYTAWLLGLYFFPPNFVPAVAAGPVVFWAM